MYALQVHRQGSGCLCVLRRPDGRDDKGSAHRGTAAAAHCGTPPAALPIGASLVRWPGVPVRSTRDHSALADALFVGRRVLPLEEVCPHRMSETFCSIGGENGWFGYEVLWTVRGLIDKLVGGYGLSRGRRDPNTLRIGDSVDFWKVVDLKTDERLLLYAQMKLPGKAWLEFRISEGNLYQTAYFYPHGLAGRLYWYALVPFHNLVFQTMAANLLRRAKEEKNSD